MTKIFGTKTERITGDWRKLHTEQLHSSHLILSKWKRWDMLWKF